MLVLFRTLRRVLLSEGGAGRFFLFALGEILLIVLGILLALQVDAWKDARADRQEELVILENLRADFVNTIDEFGHLNRIRNTVIENSRQLIAISRTDERSPEQLDALLRNTLYSPTFNNQGGALQVLFASGKINLVSNNELKNRLIAWPGKLEDMTEEEITSDQLYRGPYRSALRHHISHPDVATNWRQAGLDFSSDKLVDLEIDDGFVSRYEELLADRAFINLLSERILELGISVTETAFLIEQAEAVIALIDQELEQDP